MFETNFYILILLSISSTLVGLLGSTSIFVSLIVQRRVERLQEIFEDLINLSFNEEKNLTSEIYELINRYQMHYILPHGPSNTITWYIDFSIMLTISMWILAITLAIKGSIAPLTIFLLLPLVICFPILLFFRKLLINAINPLDNKMFNSILPSPVKLRSISYLSNYVNISVKALLKQSRLNVSIERKVSEKKHPSIKGKVVLKQELSFDDYYYYISIYDDKRAYFIGFGYLDLSFPPDSITKKPVPILRNINVNLGYLLWNNLNDYLTVSLLVFPLGDKNPIQFDYSMLRDGSFFVPHKDTRCFINQNIIYKIDNGNLKLIRHESNLPYLAKVFNFYSKNNERCFVQEPYRDFNKQRIQICSEPSKVQ
ncbi:hypothetical protein [Desulfitibacter alkalitolerans]|uniref:hypothetical protein n=1 Tax=Desulfitibacter alkalitolerans TaxID=264641 RepID=UPI0004824B88|nr:hypothetical protein [Desulfitibacter alkalitolerans]